MRSARFGLGATAAVTVPPNVITANRRGVFVTGAAAVDNPILGNAIDLNLGLGTDLDPSGVTANDPGDVDGGPNDLQNNPDFVLQYVNPAGTPTVRWSLDSAVMTSYRVEVFAGPACDPSGSGEGAALLSATVVRTGRGGGLRHAGDGCERHRHHHHSHPGRRVPFDLRVLPVRRGPVATPDRPWPGETPGQGRVDQRVWTVAAR